MVVKGIASPLRSLPFEVWHGPLDIEAALAGRHRRVVPAARALSEGTQIPASTVYTVKRRQRGLVVWAVQKALDVAGSPGLALDGVFGGRTEEAVEDFQDRVALNVDGVFGPLTSRAMARDLEDRVVTLLPVGLLHGQVGGESGDLIGAVNWSVPGGVDCSYTQRRVYSPDFGDVAIEERAFNPRYQLALSARTLRAAHNGYFGQPGAGTHERAWRLAAQKHNYPAGADAVASLGIGGLSSYYTTRQPWVVAIGARFADGAPVETPLEWMRFYALGAPAHQHLGLVTQFVTDWRIR